MVNLSEISKILEISLSPSPVYLGRIRITDSSFPAEAFEKGFYLTMRLVSNP